MASERTASTVSEQWERWTHLSHRYVLPVAAGTALTFGAALMADFQPAVVRYLPELLVGVGGVALATSFGFLIARRKEAALRAAASAHAPFRRARALRPPVVRREPVDAAPLPHGGSPWPTAYAGTPSWNGSYTTSSPGEVLWHEWLTAVPEDLGAELIGPVPETLYNPIGADAGGVIRRRDEDLVFAEGLAEAPEGDGSPSAIPLATPQGWSSGSLSFPDLELDPVELEALNHIPPYLRFSAGLGPRPAPAPAPPSLPATPAIPSQARDSCSTCLTTLADSHWQPCPGCYQPICGDCAVDSLVSYGATGCVGCVQNRP